MKRILALVLCIIMCCICVIGYADGLHQQMEDLKNQMGKNVGPVGINTPLTTKDDIVITVRGYIEDVGGRELAGRSLGTPAKGNVYVYILVDIENKSNTSVEYDFILDQNWTSVDREDVYYSFDASLNSIPLELTILMQDTITAKQKYSGYYPVEVPKNWKNIRFRIQSKNQDLFYLFDVFKTDVLGKSNTSSSGKNSNQSGNAGSSSTEAQSAATIKTDLSRDRKCPAKPTLYTSARYKSVGSDQVAELRKGFSAKQINETEGSRVYGMYFKFTPKSGDHGYHISRFDVVITEKNGDILFADGFNTDMTCQRGYYWAWNFFPLDGMFRQLKQKYGEVVPGTYTMDIYFNSLWANSTKIKVGK